jgi:hypothetical protein
LIIRRKLFLILRKISSPMKRFLPDFNLPSFKTSLSLGLAFSLTCSAVAETPTQIANVSSRVLCARKDGVTLNEFAVVGPGSEYFILRGLGPSLRQYGVTNALRNPVLEMLNPDGDIIAYNDDWVDSPDKNLIIQTGLAPTKKRESAIVATVAPGIYTSVVYGARGTGVTLAEVFRLSSSDDNTLISGIGTRGFVSTGDNVMISGFIVTGTSPFPMLVRVLGPSLTGAGIPQALADTTVALYSSSGAVIASNDNWRDTQEAEILATGLAPTNDLESAIVITLTPGAYTTVVSGAGGTEGIGFVQYYSLDHPGPELNPAPIIP